MNTKNGIVKMTIACLAGTSVALTFHRIMSGRIMSRFHLEWVQPPLILWISITILLAGVGTGISWIVRERRGLNSRIQYLITWMLRISLAFDLCVFGFQKIFRMQFIVPLAMLDEPFSSLSPESLTWAYFGQSYPYTVAIGIGQIVGGLLLVINRTRLLATFIIFPVLLNIILIDYFYSLHLPVLIHAIVLLLSCLYIMLLDLDGLKALFLPALPVRKGIVIPITLLLTAYILTSSVTLNHGVMRGKFPVITDQTVDSAEVRLPMVVYFDYGNEIVFQFDDYRNRYYGTYRIENDSLKVHWHYPAGTASFTGRLILRDGVPISLAGSQNSNTIDLRFANPD